jgi:two-component system cell cycle sensor histidine kinase/response regulator CckA
VHFALLIAAFVSVAAAVAVYVHVQAGRDARSASATNSNFAARAAAAELGEVVWALDGSVAGQGPELASRYGEDKSAALAAGRRLERRQLAIIGLGLVGVLFAAFMLYRRVARPIARLGDAVAAARGQSRPEPVPVEGPAEVATLAAGVNSLIASVHTELEERRQVEEQLRRSEASYRILFQRHPSSMWVYEPHSLRFLAVNDAAVSTYGYSRDEFLAMTLEDIRPPEDAPALREVMADPEARGSEGRIWRLVTKGGASLDVSISSTSIEFEGRAARLALTHDVSEQRRLESQLLQAQKMEAIGNLAAGIAHDFNNVLTVVRTSAMLLLEQLDDPLLREDVERIDSAAERATTLTRQLLAFSRRQVLRPEVVDMNDVVEEARVMLDRLIGDDISISYALVPGMRPIVIDRGQLVQVILNLAVNARDAMPRGGTLAIRTSAVVLDEAYAADHVGVQPGAYVLLQVTDTGIGMDEETRLRAFDPFFTTKADGTGLGLATAYGVVNQSNGHIWLYSEPGLGSAFKLYFPQSAERVAVAPPSAADLPSVRGEETILVVEDDPSVRPLVALLLERYGYHVLATASAEGAIELVEGTEEEIDLVLTDVVMPGLNGRELAERLETLRPGMKVLFTSGYPADTLVRHGIADASAAYLEKPYLPDELARKLRQLLDAIPDIDLSAPRA